MAAPRMANWERVLARLVGVPATPENLRYFDAWTRAEGGGAANNPFNTTEPGFGTTGNYNSVGVKQYDTPMHGLQATAATLKNGRYANILAALSRGNNAMADAQALAASPWGTGALVEKVLGGPVAAPPPGPGAMTPSGGTKTMTPSGVNVGGSDSRQKLAALLLGGAGRVDFSSNQVNPPNLMALAEMRQMMGATGSAPPPVSGSPRAPMSTRVVSTSSPLPSGLFEGDTTGVNSSFLSKVAAAAKAAGATHIRITSGFRSPDHNAAVGGVSHSNHTMGHALDGDAFIPGKGWVPLGAALLPVVGKFGLRSGDVPGFFNGGTDPVHVDDGWNLSH